MMIDLEPETHAALKLEALKRRTTLRKLTDTLLRYGLANLAPAPECLTAEKPRLPASRHRWVKAILAAHPRLLAKNKPAWRFDLKDWSAESGLYPSEALKALRALQDEGSLVCEEIQDLLEQPRDGEQPKMIQYWHAPRLGYDVKEEIKP